MLPKTPVNLAGFGEKLPRLQLPGLQSRVAYASAKAFLISTPRRSSQFASPSWARKLLTFELAQTGARKGTHVAASTAGPALCSREPVQD
jgi:hypothetical protein